MRAGGARRFEFEGGVYGVRATLEREKVEDVGKFVGWWVVEFGVYVFGDEG